MTPKDEYHEDDEMRSIHQMNMICLMTVFGESRVICEYNLSDRNHM